MMKWKPLQPIAQVLTSTYMYIAIHGFKLLCDNISWNSCIVLIYIIYTNNSTTHVLQNIYM